MYKIAPLLIQRCRTLRRRGFTLGDIIRIVNLPKTTVYDHIRDINLPLEIKNRINKTHTRRLIEFNYKRKGKCRKGKSIVKPRDWSKRLILLTAHLIFDGEITISGCIYQNRNEILINRVKILLKKLFGLTPFYRFYKETGVHRISYYNVELANYFKKKSKQIKNYILTASLEKKRLFLRAFFDDEGSVYYWNNIRRVRGYQNDLKILELVQKLLKDFDINSKIDKKYKEIIISRKENLIKFQDKINFSKGVSINSGRKNSIWKKDIEKKEILQMIINSYQK